MSEENSTPENGELDEDLLVESTDETPAAEAGQPEPDPLAVLAAERDDYKDKWLRAHAETENVRKRSRREVVDAAAFARADVIRDLLEVLDNFDRATASLDAADDESAGLEAVRSGLTLVHESLRETLRRRGLEPVPAETGQTFDPELHEAVMQMESDTVESGAIVDVAQVGYRLGDLVLRPSRVVVAQ
jgi:molecular chaperone GrpE